MHSPFKGQKAFTLVELAIVMTIIGLLIGGILKGQELLENARVTSTIAQVKSYEASVTAFRDIYDGLPGDLKEAGNKIAGCNMNCSPFEDTAGDGIINSAMGGYANIRAVWITNQPPSSEIEEWPLFWMHLLKANLITGVTDAPLQTPPVTSAEAGVSLPAAKIGGAFLIGHVRVDDMLPPSSIMAATKGIFLAIVSVDRAQSGLSLDESISQGTEALTPMRAAQIDRKVDDGKPNTGSVLATGIEASCLAPDPAGGYMYLENTASKDCDLLLKIQD